MSKIDSWRAEFLLPMAGVFVVLLGILMLLSWFPAAHIRRQMMGMEPKANRTRGPSARGAV
ncbi:hypothetical protein ACP0HM_33075 [Escherichia coli]